MNELEKTIIDLDLRISDMEDKKKRTYIEYQDLTKKREHAEETLGRYDRKISRLNGELTDMKTRRVAMITIPGFGFPITALALVCGTPLSLSAAILLAGCAAGYRLANDMVNYGYMNSGDDKLLRRLFPALRRKESEVKKAKAAYDRQSTKVEELVELENEALDKHNQSVEDLVKLNARSKDLKGQYFSKVRRDYLPYYTELEEVIAKTIKNPSQFYTNICNGLNHKERRDIIADMSGKTCANCTNGSCQLTDEEKAQMTDCKSWFNEVEIGMSKVLRR